MPSPITMECLTCRYPLDGLDRPRCPECGREFDKGDPTTYRTHAGPAADEPFVPVRQYRSAEIAGNARERLLAKGIGSRLEQRAAPRAFAVLVPASQHHAAAAHLPDNS